MAKRTIQQSILDAVDSGILPHEWLLEAMRGNPILQREKVPIRDNNGNIIRYEIVESEEYVPVGERVDIAKTLLPYFAPKLSAQTVRIEGEVQHQSLESLAGRLVDLNRKVIDIQDYDADIATQTPE